MILYKPVLSEVDDSIEYSLNWYLCNIRKKLEYYSRPQD